MVGRRLCSEEEAILRGFLDGLSLRRRAVLRETLAAFEDCEPPDRYTQLAAANLARWKAASGTPDPGLRLGVLAGDWGEVARRVTMAFGECFAVLNMANAYVAGGAYVEGAPAQEENMFRRTDCHFHVGEDEYDSDLDRYRPGMTRLLSAADGRVYLDTAHPRVCIRGPEDRSRDDLGYAWLPDDQVFPYYELRASAQDLRDGRAFDPAEARRRIRAQLATLCEQGIRHVVFGAFGCGAFLNPASEVARLYREEIEARVASFSVIAFAIHSSGYGPDNVTPFSAVLGGASCWEPLAVAIQG